MAEYFFEDACDTQKLSSAIAETLGKWSGSIESGPQGTKIIFLGRRLNPEELQLLGKLVKENLASEELKERWAKPIDPGLCQDRATLHYFECMKPEIQLEPGLMIRAATESEKSRWKDPRFYNHVLEYTYDIEHGDKNLMDLVIMALVAFKDGQIKMDWKAGGIMKQEKDQSPAIMPRELQYDDRYLLNETEIDPFMEFWKTLRKGRTPAPVLLAGKRLVASNSSKDFENRIRDCITALECLVIRKHERKKKEKLVDRIALLLAGTPDWEKRIRSELDLACEIRHDIVHDGEPSEENMRKLAAFPSMFCDFLQDYIRCTIKAYFLLIEGGFCKDKDDLIEKLSPPVTQSTIQGLARLLKNLPRF